MQHQQSHVFFASECAEHQDRAISPPKWCFAELAGRLVEISAYGNSSVLSATASLISEAQQRGECCAWIARPDSTFYPPDFYAWGIDLLALPVIRTTDVGSKDMRTSLRSLERLLRSGAFGLIVVDVGGDARLPLHAQGRLSKLAKRHHTAVVFLSEKTTGKESMGSMISLHVQALRHYEGSGQFCCTIFVQKDKSRGLRWQSSEVIDASCGLY